MNLENCSKLTRKKLYFILLTDLRVYVVYYIFFMLFMLIVDLCMTCCVRCTAKDIGNVDSNLSCLKMFGGTTALIFCIICPAWPRSMQRCRIWNAMTSTCQRLVQIGIIWPNMTSWARPGLAAFILGLFLSFLQFSILCNCVLMLWVGISHWSTTNFVVLFFLVCVELPFRTC